MDLNEFLQISVEKISFHVVDVVKIAFHDKCLILSTSVKKDFSRNNCPKK